MPSKKSPSARGFRSASLSDKAFGDLTAAQGVYHTPSLSTTVERLVSDASCWREVQANPKPAVEGLDPEFVRIALEQNLSADAQRPLLKKLKHKLGL